MALFYIAKASRDTRASVHHIWRFILVLDKCMAICLHRFSFAGLVSYPLGLHSDFFCVMAAANELKVVDCTHEHTFLSCFSSFSRLLKTCGLSICKIKCVKFRLNSTVRNLTILEKEQPIHYCCPVANLLFP